MQSFRLIAVLLATLYTALAVLPVGAFIFSALSESSSSGFEWREFLHQAVRIEPLLNSLIIAVLTALISTVVGVPLGFLLCRTDLSLRAVSLSGLVMPLFIPPFLWAGAWQLLGLFPLTGVLGSVFVLCVSLHPIVILLAAAGFMRINPGCEDKARMDASEIIVFLRISLPLASPLIVTGSLLVFIISLSDFGVPSLMQVNVYPVAVFTAFSAFLDFRQAAALCLPLALVAGLSGWLCNLLHRKRNFVTFSEQTDMRLVRLNTWRKPALVYVLAWISFCSLLPVSTLVFKSQMTMLSEDVPGTVLRSILYAATGASVLSVLACLLAWTISRQVLPGGAWWIALQPFLFGLPSAVIGLGLVALWNRPILGSVYGTSFMVVMGYIARFLPLALIAFYSSCRMLPRDCEEAALTYGGGFYSIVRNAIVPYLWRPIILVWTFTFVLCMGELAATILVSPPGMQTLAVQLFTVEANAPAGKIAALSIVVLASTLFPTWVILLIALNVGRSAKKSSSNAGW